MTNTTAAATVAIDLLSDFRVQNGGAMPLGTTVTRVRGLLGVSLATAPAGAQDGAAHGLIVESTSDTAATLPDPSATADFHEDWLSRFPSSPFVEGGGDRLNYAFWVDVRSQRKMGELNQTLWYVASGVVGGVPTDGWYLDLSVLLKLP